jgi:hypothetical protein
MFDVFVTYDMADGLPACLDVLSVTAPATCTGI